MIIMGDFNEKWFDRLAQRRRSLANQLHDPAAAGFWRMVVDKYSGQAHFVLELLQNADDALASSAKLILRRDSVCFYHDGSVHFSLTDPDDEREGTEIGHINSLTSIGASNKIAENKIGKFGIGFKSVFMYTDRPHIEDDSFSFALEDYIVPVLEGRSCGDRKRGETSFLLPLKSSQLYDEILSSLDNLDNPLYFLNNLTCFEVSAFDDQGCLVLSRSFSKSKIRTLEIQDSDFETIKYHFYKFNIDNDVHYRHYFVSTCDGHDVVVAYDSDSDGRPLRLNESTNKCFCFFELEECFDDLQCVFHAPLHLTENRERFKRNDDWNQIVLKHVAHLMAASLYFLCVLSEECYSFCFDNIMDFVLLKCPKDDVFLSDIYKSFVDRLSSDKVFYTRDAGYVDASHVRFPISRQVQQLLPDGVLISIFPEYKGSFWGLECLRTTNDHDENEKRKKQLAFLTGNNIVQKMVTLTEVLSRTTADTVYSLSKEELISFYSVLSTNMSLCSDEDLSLKTKPLILCSDGVVRAAFSESGAPLVFLPGPSCGDLPVVDLDVVGDNSALRFLKNIGVAEPGAMSLIVYHILPLYKDGAVDITNMQLMVSHLMVFVEAFSDLAFDDENRSKYLSLFSNVDFIPTADCFGVPSFHKPSSVYFNTSELNFFFKDNPDVFFLQDGLIEQVEPHKRQSVYYFLSSLGVSFLPRVKSVFRQPDEDVLSILQLKPVSLRKSDNGGQVIEDKVIDGFEFFISHLQFDSSFAFFKLLSKMIGECGAFCFSNMISGTYKYFEKAKKTPTVVSFSHTTALSQIMDACWLFDENSVPFSPSVVVESTSLSHRYYISDEDRMTLLYLGIQYVDLMPNLTEHQRKAVTMISRLHDSGYSDDMLQKLVEGKLILVEK